MQTEICRLLDIRYPVFQGGMAWIADGRLAAAVSEGGGLGIIAAGNAPASYVEEQIHFARKRTEKPFGLNVMLRSPFADEVADLAAREGVRVVTTGAGNPAAFMDRWCRAGCAVIPVVASVAMAKLIERAGAAAVIAEGCESGGHVGETTTMALVPQVCDAVRLPVIAAGGIADGRGFAAALMLGAQGIQMGTRFLCAGECTIHSVYREKILRATDRSTIVTGRRNGHPVRSLRTAFSRRYEEAEYRGASETELDVLGTGALRLAVQEGDLESGCFLSGQIAGLVKRVQPAAEIVEEVTKEAEQCLKGTSRWVR